MEKIRCQLTVFFEDPFWVGVYERVQWNKLRFSPAVSAESSMDRPINPKRMQRQTQKQLNHSGIGTKSQQALQLQREEGKAARKKKSWRQRDEEQQRKYELKRGKRKEKHRGK